MQRLSLATATLVLLVGLTPAAHAADDIVIGVSAPLTGPAASISEISMPGMKQAVADINAKGGVQGRKIRLEIMDDACDPKQAVNIASKLAGMNVDAVISPACSGAVKAAAPIYEEEGLPFIASVASNVDLTKQGYETLFRLSSRDDQDAEVAINYIASTYAGKTIAIVDDKEVWGIDMAGIIEKGLKAKGFKKIDRFQMTPGEQDYNAVVSRLKAGNYDIVYPAALMREAGMLVRQMTDAGYKPTIISSICLAMPDAAAIMGPAIVGAYYTRVAMSPEALAVSRKLDARNEDTGIFNVQSYAAVEVLAQAVVQGGGKPADTLKLLKSNTFQTIMGPLKFAANGDISDMKFEVMQAVKAPEGSGKLYQSVKTWPKVAP